MDYRGLYHDLADMERRALIAVKECEIAGNHRQAVLWDDFIWELQTFMGVIVLQRW